MVHVGPTVQKEDTGFCGQRAGPQDPRSMAIELGGEVQHPNTHSAYRIA